MEIPFEKSFASHPKAYLWSSKNTLTAREVCTFSSKYALFDCNNCNHTFESMIARTAITKHGCPYCYGNKLCTDMNCMMCYNNSAASLDKIKYWSSLNDIHPRFVRKGTKTKYLFDCEKCNHKFSSSLNNITAGNWCPYCCINSILLCNDINCIHCFKKSFASSKKSKHWSPNNTVIPREVFKKSDRKYLFICKYCNNEYSKRLLCVEYGGGCPYCKNKTELKLFTWLKKHYINILFQVKYDWCRNPKTNSCLPFDFEYENIIIELDGPQHYTQISNWRPVEEQREIDKLKMNFAIKNNKHLIRILQKDVADNSTKWKDKLTDCINELLLTPTPTIMYINIDSSYFM